MLCSGSEEGAYLELSNSISFFRLVELFYMNVAQGVRNRRGDITDAVRPTI